MSKNKTLTVNKVVNENTIFALEISEIGKAFLGTMIVKGSEYYGVSCQAKTEGEIKDNFELFRSGFQKLNHLISEESQVNVPDHKRITLKEMRAMSGVHPAILAEQLGVSINHLKGLEDGKARKALTCDQVFMFYKSTYVKESKIDFIQWSPEQQKKPIALECDKAYK